MPCLHSCLERRAQGQSRPTFRPSGRWFVKPGVGLACAWASASACAVETGARGPDPNLGPWIFASIALVMVAVLAWWLGHAAGRKQARTEYRAKRGDSGFEPLPSSQTTQVQQRKAPVTGPDDAEVISYALSHDLRAPLRVVEGFARILKEDYGRQLDRIGNDHLDRLMGAAARMQTMLEGMLSLAKLSTQPRIKRRVSLSQMALEIMGEFQSLNPAREISVEIAPDLEAVGDPTLLRQMMENLLSNAWKYTARTAHPRISLRAVERKDELMLYEVADNGAGFSMVSAGRLFALFQRMHGQSDFPGNGLGLASVQRIVRLHGGTVWAEAKVGQGARFYFTLPG